MTRALSQLLLVSTFLTAAILSAQDPSRLAVSGTVLDPHQSAVLGATITLKRLDGAEVQTTTAGSSGEFRFQGVSPGNYEVRIEQEGFKPSVSRVRVGNQSPRPLSVVLNLADVRQEITIGADTGQVRPLPATTSIRSR